MKFVLLTTRVVFLSLISSSLFVPNLLAANQGNSNRKTYTVPINKSKIGAMGTSVANSNSKTVTTINATPVNKSKQIPTPAQATLPEADQYVLQSRDIGSFGPQWQTFSDYLTVPKGCDSMPLYINFTNGAGSGILFRDLRIALAGKSLATIKDFKGPSLTCNLAGVVGVGNNLLTVQAYGPAGAKLTWKFITAKIVVTKVNPNSFGPTDKATIEGRNFSDRTGATQVLINDKVATVVTAKKTSIDFKPPAGLTGGKANLVIAIGPLRSVPISVTIKGAPEITAVSMVSTAPGQPLTITGKGFSAMSSENVVTIGGFPAEITACSPTSISCIVPMSLDPLSPIWYVPIKVKTNGMEGKDPEKRGLINIQTRVFGDEHMPSKIE